MGAARSGGTTKDIVQAALESAGYTPTAADLDQAVGAVEEAGDVVAVEVQAQRFASWYSESVFATTLLEEVWQQTQRTLRLKRNRLLAETLQIPHELWGFKEDEWGGVFPEMGLMQQ